MFIFPLLLDVTVNGFTTIISRTLCYSDNNFHEDADNIHRKKIYISNQNTLLL